jgi:hypothetical protein
LIRIAAIILCLTAAGCLDCKHDPNKQINLYQECRENDDHLIATYCQNIAEEGSRIEGTCK